MELKINKDPRRERISQIRTEIDSLLSPERRPDPTVKSRTSMILQAESLLNQGLGVGNEDVYLQKIFEWLDQLRQTENPEGNYIAGLIEEKWQLESEMNLKDAA